MTNLVTEVGDQGMLLLGLGQPLGFGLGVGPGPLGRQAGPASIGRGRGCPFRRLVAGPMGGRQLLGRVPELGDLLAQLDKAPIGVLDDSSRRRQLGGGRLSSLEATVQPGALGGGGASCPHRIVKLIRMSGQHGVVDDRLGRGLVR